jgi:hypothetical protein
MNFTQRTPGDAGKGSGGRLMNGSSGSRIPFLPSSVAGAYEVERTR